MSSHSSLASLSHQLEESRARQLQERSSRALQLMRTAVEWKSWEELRTLTKAFQRYLEEIRETDIRRRGDIEASLSRVCAARDQLATVKTHKQEATEQVAKLSADNEELRRQLEFDARQFVALLQSCAHLEKQLVALRNGKERDPAEEPGAAHASDHSEFGNAADIRSCEADALAAVDEDAHDSPRPQSEADAEGSAQADIFTIPEQPCSGDVAARAVAVATDHLSRAQAAETDADPICEGEQAGASPSASPQKSDESPATVVAADDADLPSAWPCSHSQPEAAEASSQTTNQRLLQVLRQDALGVLQSLATVKQKLLKANSPPREPLVSSDDGTPALKDPVSPEHGQDDDSTSTAMASGTSRSSGGGHAPTGDAGSHISPPEERKSRLLPGSPGPGTHPCDVASPLRPSALAAAEAARWAQACASGVAKAPESPRAWPGVTWKEAATEVSQWPAAVAPMILEPVASEPRAATASSLSQPVVSNGILKTPTKLASSPSQTAAAGQSPDAYVLSPTSQLVQSRRGRGHAHLGSPIRSPVRSQVWRGAPRSPERGASPPSTAPPPTSDSAERLKTSLKQLPVVPPLPFQSPRSPLGAQAQAPASLATQRHGAALAAKPGLGETATARGSPPGRRADASYVATIQLVRELNNGNVPAATSASGPPGPYKGLPQKEVNKLTLTKERARRREAPMSRDLGEAPRRQEGKRRDQDRANAARTGPRAIAPSAESSTKASL